MKRLLFLLLLLPFFANASTWFVSSSGSDSNSGTSSGSPFLTLQRVQTAYHSGDIIQINCNGTYTGALTISAASQVIKYGSGNLPIISGFETLTGAVNVGTNLWRYHDTNLGTTVKVFTINGTQYAPGRFPKATYATYTASSGNTSITSAALSGSWGANAQVVIRKNHFNLSTYQIASVVGNVINYSGGSGDTPTPGCGAFIQNSLNALTQNGDYYYDGAGNLTLYWVGTPPVDVKASRYDKLINIISGGAAIVSGISFTGANGYGLYANNTSAIQVLNSTFTLCDVGLYFNNNSASIVNNCIFDKTNSNAVTFATSNTNTLTNSTITNAGKIPGLASEYSGVRIVPNTARNTTITNTSVSFCGYNGFLIQGQVTMQDVISHDNVSVLDDGANVYFDCGHTPVVIPASVIDHVVAYNAIGAPAGTNNGLNQASNFYFDDNSNHFTIANCTAYNAGLYNYFLHNDNNMMLSNCTGYNAPASLAMIHDVLGGKLSNISLSNNQFIGTTPSQYIVIFKTSDSDPTQVKSWGTSANSRYGSTATTTNPFQTFVGGVTTNLTIAGWQTATAQDGSSTYVTVPSPTIWSPNPSASPITTSIAAVYKDLAGTSYNPPSFSVSAYSSRFVYYFGTVPIAPPNISVSPTTYSFPINLPIAPINFTNTGGAATFSISPTQPPTFLFNTTNGTIQGIPTLIQSATSYVVTATNLSGSSHVTISLAVFTNPSSSVLKVGCKCRVKP